MNSLKSAVSDFIKDEGGQGITEYYACIAFIGVLVALCFALSQGSFADTLFQSFSNMSGQIHRLIAGVPESPPPI